MKWTWVLTIGLVFSSAPLMAQSRPLILTLDSLQRNVAGYALHTHPWQYHPGDDMRWASPAFDDRNWLSHQTSFGLHDAPPGWKGIGWFRLHIQLDSLSTTRMLSLLLEQVGASEVYVDGQIVGGFGAIGHSSATGTDYVPFAEPIFIRLNRPGNHLLAVRLATFRPYVLRWARYPQGFQSCLGPADRIATDLIEQTRIWSINLVSIFVPGVFALLHLFLFLFYPARRSNLYYSLWLALFAGGSTCVYFDRFTHNPATLQTMAYTFWLANVVDGLIAVVFIYSVCYAKAPRQVWGFSAIALLLAVVLLFIHSLDAVNWVFFFVLLCLLEVFRVVIRAGLRRQPGVWLIGAGLLGIAIGIFIGAGDVLHIWQGNSFGQNLFLTLSFLTLPLFTSLYLAQDFGRTSRELASQLRQVEALSAEARAQEAEKLRLVAEQNEQLEQTVRERTGQLQQQTNKLRELDAFKSRFFTNLTHEFRTPLTLIIGPAEQVLTQTKDPQIKQQVGLIQRNGSRLLRLINQLLDLSKLEAGKMELTRTPGDLVSFVRGTLHSFESLAHHKGIAMQFTTTQERWTTAFDRDALEKILYNLLSNALKFTPSSGVISVTLNNDEEGWVQLAVQDTGLGVPAAKLPYLYDRFYQWSATAVDASDTGMPDHREQEGTGIGLALTKELVELHGGTIDIASEVGVGTTVSVRLPAQPESLEIITPKADSLSILLPTTTPDREPDVRTRPLDAPLVLLIEDNADVRAFLYSSLNEHFRIIEAPNGEEGVWLAQQQVPDLVITDLMMPRMNGYQVCAMLKGDERTSHIPIIMLTAKADLESKLEGLGTGADSYLAKPFNQRELLAQINNLIQTRRQLRERYSRNGNNPWTTDMPMLPSMEQVFLDRVRSAIEASLADEQYNLERLSDDVGMSRTQLHRKLKALINQSPGDLIRLIRLQRAHELLRGHVGTVAEVAYQVGFGNPANFATSFSRQFGYAPSEVKKQ